MRSPDLPAEAVQIMRVVGKESRGWASAAAASPCWQAPPGRSNQGSRRQLLENHLWTRKGWLLKYKPQLEVVLDFTGFHREQISRLHTSKRMTVGNNTRQDWLLNFLWVPPPWTQTKKQQLQQKPFSEHQNLLIPLTNAAHAGTGVPTTWQPQPPILVWWRLLKDGQKAMMVWGPNPELSHDRPVARGLQVARTAVVPTSPAQGRGRSLLSETRAVPQPSLTQTNRAGEQWIHSFSPQSLLSISALTPLSFISFSKDTFRDETIHNCLSTDSLWQHNWQWVCCKNENAVLITLA